VADIPQPLWWLCGITGMAMMVRDNAMVICVMIDSSTIHAFNHPLPPLERNKNGISSLEWNKITNALRP